jgi:hypothetical protein
VALWDAYPTSPKALSSSSLSAGGQVINSLETGCFGSVCFYQMTSPWRKMVALNLERFFPNEWVGNAPIGIHDGNTSSGKGTWKASL